MNQINPESNFKNEKDEVQLKEVILALWNGKILIGIITVTTLIFSLLYSFFLPNLYSSTAILAATQTESEINNSLRSYSGIASLAGVELPTSGASLSAEAVETIKSLKFHTESFLPNIELKNLMAIQSWNSEVNKIEYDKSVYDEKNNKWIHNSSPNNKLKPSPQDSLKIFLEKNFQIEKKDNDAFFKITVTHHSPYIAKKWLEILIKKINFVIREEQKNKSQKSVDYLNEQISITNYTEIKVALSTVLQREIEKLAIIEANEDYVFKTIDPPFIPEQKSSPNRALICLIGILIGFFIGSFVALRRFFKAY